MAEPSSPVPEETGTPAQTTPELEVMQSSPEDLRLIQDSSKNVDPQTKVPEKEPPTSSPVPRASLHSSGEEVSSSSCASPVAQCQSRATLPPIATLKPDLHPSSYQKTADPETNTYLPDFSDLCQDNYNFWQPFFDGNPQSSGTQPPSGTGSSLAELDYLLERAGLYQSSAEVTYRNQWEELAHEPQHQQFFQTQVDPLKSMYHAARSQPPALTYGGPAFSYPALLPPQSFPAQSSHARTYGDCLYGREDAQMTSGRGEPVAYLNEPQMIEYSVPSLKRAHYEEDPSKQHIHLQPEPVYHQKPAVPTPVRSVDANPVLLCAYPISYGPYQNQAKARNQPIYLQVRAPVDAARQYQPCAVSSEVKRSKTVKSLLQQERSYAAAPPQRVPSQSQTYWRPAAENPSKNSPVWTFQVPSGAGKTAKHVTMESALAGLQMKPGTTVANVYPIPPEMGSMAFKRPRKDPPKFEALKAALLEEKKPPVKTSNSQQFRAERVDARVHRPRHYELQRLEIGNFLVNLKPPMVGKRSQNKVKILFTKRRFVYEFETPQTKSLQRTMCCIQVPFSIVEALNCEENHLRLLVTRQPAMYLGERNPRCGVVGYLTVFDTSQPVDLTNGDISRYPLHKITLRKNHAEKLLSYLLTFDGRFQTLSQIPIPESVPCRLLPSPVEYDFGQSSDQKPDIRKLLSSTGSSATTPSPSKRTSTRLTRPPRRYCPAATDESDSGEGQSSVLMCTCRISCRSVRCSCVKGARKCGSAPESRCQCSNCDNPLNILENVGVNLVVAVQDVCLMQNVYRIMYLKSYLERCIQLDCCGFLASVRDSIPGILPCPNPKCSAQLEYSWCRGSVYNAALVRRNHCAICAKCCSRDQRHCLQCNRCFDFGTFRNRCPTCGSNNGWPVLSTPNPADNSEK